MNRDVLSKVALELDLPDILSMCLTNKNFKGAVCDNDFFWLNKLMKDAPNLTKNWRNIKEETNTKTYKEIYEKASLFLVTLTIVIEGPEGKYDNSDSDDSDHSDDEESEYEPELTDREVSKELEFRFESLESIRDKIYKIIRDYFQVTGYLGYHIISIDDDETCNLVKSFQTKECFEKINYDTKNIDIFLSTNEKIDDGYEMDYDEIFTSTIADNGVTLA